MVLIWYIPPEHTYMLYIYICIYIYIIIRHCTLSYITRYKRDLRFLHRHENTVQKMNHSIIPSPVIFFSQTIAPE